jgi:hypothetical protein
MHSSQDKIFQIVSYASDARIPEDACCSGGHFARKIHQRLEIRFELFADLLGWVLSYHFCQIVNPDQCNPSPSFFACGKAANHALNPALTVKAAEV